MDKYSVEVKFSARKELDALPNLLLARVLRKLESLADVPRPAGCKKLKGYKDQWRIRIGDGEWSTSSMKSEAGECRADRASARGLRIIGRPSTALCVSLQS